MQGISEEMILHGDKVSLKFVNNFKFDEFCTDHIAGYDAARFEPVALRVFAAQEFIVTVYAADRSRQPQPGEKLMVRKFKIEGLTPATLFSYVTEYNFTVFRYSGADLEVINK